MNEMARIVYIRYAVMEEDYVTINQEIKKYTSNDLVCAALVMLRDDSNDAKGWGKAAYSEMYYHINCLRDAHRTCKITQI